MNWHHALSPYYSEFAQKKLEFVLPDFMSNENNFIKAELNTTSRTHDSTEEIFHASDWIFHLYWLASMFPQAVLKKSSGRKQTRRESLCMVTWRYIDARKQLRVFASREKFCLVDAL